MPTLSLPASQMLPKPLYFVFRVHLWLPFSSILKQNFNENNVTMDPKSSMTYLPISPTHILPAKPPRKLSTLLNTSLSPSSTLKTQVDDGWRSAHDLGEMRKALTAHNTSKSKNKRLQTAIFRHSALPTDSCLFDG